MLSIAVLQKVRFFAYIAIIVLSVVELIVDAVNLAALNDTVVVGGIRYSFGDSGAKGASGWTMFVTLITLLVAPLLAFGSILTNKGIPFVHLFNRLFFELITVVVFLIFWFISGVVMAVYAPSGSCHGISVCSKMQAATAFPWLNFFAFLVVTIVLTILLLKVRSNGGNAQTTLTYEIENDYPAVTAGAPEHNIGYPSGGVQPTNESYYNLHPDVNMPVPNTEHEK
ncbi:hypothetical protein GGI07_002465 [Coemansia sp. Benny D115]|nr:hypothetical protein GGI07_002465 [Coemansia sp. Benny D115]